MKRLPKIEELDRMAASGRGFTREQLAVWGVAWPPAPGWIKALRREILSGAGDKILRKQNQPKGKKGRAAKKAARKYAPTPNDPSSTKAFYASWDWKKKRMEALLKHGHRCQSCGASPSNLHSVRMVVDHIKPIRKHWDLRLELSNLQVLCDDCNMGKGHWLETDFRPADGNDEMDREWREITRH